MDPGVVSFLFSRRDFRPKIPERSWSGFRLPLIRDVSGEWEWECFEDSTIVLIFIGFRSLILSQAGFSNLCTVQIQNSFQQLENYPSRESLSLWKIRHLLHV